MKTTTTTKIKRLGFFFCGVVVNQRRFFSFLVVTRRVKSVVSFNSWKNRRFRHGRKQNRSFGIGIHTVCCVYCQHRRGGRRTDGPEDSPTCCRAAWPGTACTRDRPAAWWCWTTRTCRKTAWPENRTSVFSAAVGWIVLKRKRNQMKTLRTRAPPRGWGERVAIGRAGKIDALGVSLLCACVFCHTRVNTNWGRTLNDRFGVGFQKFFFFHIFFFFYFFVFNGKTPAVSSPSSAGAPTI